MNEPEPQTTPERQQVGHDRERSNAARPKRSYKRQLTPRVVEAPKPPPRPKSATVIYRPDFGEPPEIVCFMTEINPHGMRFKANEPVEVPYSKTIDQLLVEKYETPDGVRSRAVERKVPVIDVLRQVIDGKIIVNPSFEVDGIKGERVKPLARLPTTADEYRGYCIGWISTAMSADSMDKRWGGEEGLRMRCGCSPSDIGWLRPFFDARRSECAELDRQRHVA